MADDCASLSRKLVSGSRELSQSRLLENVARAVSGFSAAGIAAEDTVAIMLRNDFPFFEASMAANLLGAHAVPINWHFQAEESGYILRDSRAKALVIHADLLPQVRAAIPEGLLTFVVPTPPEIRAAYALSSRECEPPENMPQWADWLGRHKPQEIAPPPPPSSMIYTSGTTGQPKGVRREPFTPESSAVFAQMAEIALGLGPTGDFRTVITGPMYHAAPNVYGLWAAKTGGFCILQLRFDPEELLRMIERYRITHLHMVPTMFVRLLKLSDEVRGKYDLSSLRFVVHAAAPCSAEI